MAAMAAMAMPDLIARVNIPCVGLGYSGYWKDERELARFMAHLPHRLQSYGAITLRCSPSTFDANGPSERPPPVPAAGRALVPCRHVLACAQSLCAPSARPRAARPAAAPRAPRAPRALRRAQHWWGCGAVVSATAVQVLDAATLASLGYVARTVSASVTQLLRMQVEVECCITHVTVRRRRLRGSARSASWRR